MRRQKLVMPMEPRRVLAVLEANWGSAALGRM